MMQIEVQGPVKDNARLAEAVSRATELLEAEAGSSAEPVRVEWGMARDERGNPVVELKLSDFAGFVGGRFSPEDLQDDNRVQARLRRLWGDLLEARSHKQVARLKQLVQELEGD
jgi:hypothetical protein